MTKEQFIDLTLLTLTGQANENELKHFQKGLENPEFSKLHEQIEKAWEMQELSDMEQQQLKKALLLLNEKLHPTTQLKVVRKNRRSIAYLGLTAAAVICLGLFLGRQSFFQERISTENSVVKLLVASANTGERKTIVLPDSSVVHLNSGANIKYPSLFASNNRQVELQGEAFFEVTKNPQQLFLVSANGFQVHVLGTSFNVNSTTETPIEVTVETGLVRVSNQIDISVDLAPGEQAVYDVSKHNFKKSIVQASAYSDWSREILRFNAIQLSEAFSKIEQWYGVTIQCKKEELLERRINAAYREEKLEKVLDDFSYLTNVNYRFVNDSTVYIY